MTRGPMNRRVEHLEQGPGASVVSPEACRSAIERYANVHHAVGESFPASMTPTEYAHAVENSRRAHDQRVLACWLPGDESI